MNKPISNIVLGRNVDFFDCIDHLVQLIVIKLSRLTIVLVVIKPEQR